MNDQNKDLPPLPESSAWRYRPKDGLTWPAYTEREAQALAYDAQPEPLYTADQMRDYALAALARHCAAPVVRQNGSPVAEAQPVAYPCKLGGGCMCATEEAGISEGCKYYLAPTPPAPQEVEQARDAAHYDLTAVDCPACSGQGMVPGVVGWCACEECNGQSKIIVSRKVLAAMTAQPDDSGVQG